jgi:hypothetical protein
VAQRLAAKNGGLTNVGGNNGTGVEVEGSLVSSVIDMVEILVTLFHPGMIGSLVKVVGTNKNSHGPTCAKHNACGKGILLVGVKVSFRKDRWAWRSKEEEDIMCVHLMLAGKVTCHVGMLPQHLAKWVAYFDGVYTHSVEMYLERYNKIWQIKYRRNSGLCIVQVMGIKRVIGI